MHTLVRYSVLIQVGDTKVFGSSPAGVGEGSSFARETGSVHPTSCPSQLEWMRDVLRGMEYRMGYDTQADCVVTIDALVPLLDYMQKNTEECSDKLEANETTVGKLVHSYVWSHQYH